MHASLLGFCLESLVLDNDIIGAVQRTIRGIQVDEESIAVETIRDVCLNGPGHYLGSDQTLKRMQTEYVYPVVGDRRSPNDWTERGAMDVVDRAMQKTKEILQKHYPQHVSREVDDAVRARFKVFLPREAMQA
jgi:trimethylamine---corrinoid protein Co-methyltransferase